MGLLIRMGVILALMMVGFVICTSAQVTGHWKISVNTAVGGDEAEFVFKETEGRIEGSYSGILGLNKPLKGSYEASKLSISFEGEWPSDGSTVEVKVTGQLSDDAGSGEVVVVNRTEGTWTARRVKSSDESKQADSAPAKTGLNAQAVFDRFVGEWTVDPSAAAIVENAIRRTTEPMGAITRGIARRRLSKYHAPPAQIHIQREAEFLTIKFEGFPARRLPISGAETQQGESKQRLQWIDEAGGALLQIIETEEGKQENLYRIGDRPQLLTMTVTAVSPRLPGPLQYAIEFTRAQPAAVPGQLRPNPIPAAAPGQSQSVPNFSYRFVSGVAMAQASRAATAASYLQRGQALMERGQTARALADFDLAVASDPSAAWAWLARGMARRTQSDLAGSLTDLEHAAQLDPRSAQAQQQRAATLYLQGKLVEAEEALNMALQLDPRSAVIRNDRGVLRHQRGDVAAAISEYETTLKLNPRYARTWLNRGIAFLEQGRRIEAERDFAEAVRLNPKLKTAVEQLRR